MARPLTITATVTAVPLLTLAALALAGVSAVREPDPVAVAIATSCLLALPVLGFSALLPDRRAGLLLGANAWPLLLLSGLPLYFPGERGDAIDRGMALLGVPLGDTLSADRRRALAETIDTILVEPRARQPSPTAALAVEQPPPPTRLDADTDQVALPYEGRGHSLLIPIALEGPAGVVETEMLFDTGATYTTIDERTLRRLGYRLPSNAPRITFQTANGESSSSLAVLDRIWLGGFEVPGVTVALCESCTSNGEHAGLLGLNVSSRFLITLDTARQEVILEPHADGGRPHLDVKPWLDLSGRGRSWPDGRTEVDLTATNLADRPMARVQVEVSCDGDRFGIPIGPFEARQTLEASATIPPPHDCDPFTIELAEGAW